MHRTQMTRILATSAIVLSSLCAYGQATASKVISDQILPKQTYMYVSFPNVTQMKEYVLSSSLGQLWNDPQLENFKGELHSAFDSQLQDSLLKFQETVGLSVEELLAIPNGEISFAFSVAQGNAMGAVVFLDFGDKEADVLELMDKAAEALSQVPQLSQASQSFDGTELRMFEIEHNGPAPTPLAKEFGWFIKDQRIVVSNRSELLESVLTNWEGESTDSLLSNDTYSYVMSKCQSGDRTSLTTVFVDPIGMFEKLVQTGSLGQQASMGAGMALGVLPALGLNQLRAFGSVTEGGSGPFEAISRAVVYAEQPPQGVMKVFQLGETSSTPPGWVKDDVNAYIATHWKIGEAFSAVEGLFDMFSGAGAFAELLDKAADRSPGIHPKLDVIDQLSGDIKIVTAPGEGGGYGGDQMLIALGVKNDESASAVLSKIAEAARMEDREFRGATIFEVEGPGNQSVKVTVSEGRMLLCIGGPLLEQVLRNDSDMRPLAESEEFRKIAQHFPANALSVQFSRPAEQYRGLYELLRSGEAVDQFPGMDEIFEKLDFTTLPPFENISKYIKPTGGFSTADDNGLYMEAFQLNN